MIGVVPLAGPDFEQDDGSVKATDPFRGGSLLREVLEARSWRRSGALADRDMVFVLRDSGPSRRFAEWPLKGWYPGASTVFVSGTTGGAALSALAGLALLAHRDEPVVVDLADIWFRDETDPEAAFAADAGLGGLLATFRASDPSYSYARLDRDGDVIETAEKRVISDVASAGVYLFRSPGVYTAAVARSLADPSTHTHRGLHFVCPLMNGVIALGHRVRTADVHDVEDVKRSASAGGRPCVAICISGAARLSGNALTYFARALPEGVTIDIFCYFWEGEFSDETELKALVESKLERRAGDVFVRVGRGFVPDLNFQHTVYPETNKENLMRMYAAIRRANDMKIVRELEGGFRYDVVIRHRADVAVSAELEFPKLLKLCEDFVVLPDVGHFRGGLNDQFALSSSRNMDVYSQVFDYIRQHCLHGCILHPETLLRFHLMRMRLPWVQAPLNSTIIRD